MLLRWGNFMAGFGLGPPLQRFLLGSTLNADLFPDVLENRQYRKIVCTDLNVLAVSQKYFVAQNRRKLSNDNNFLKLSGLLEHISTRLFPVIFSKESVDFVATIMCPKNQSQNGHFFQINSKSFTKNDS